MFTSSEWYVPDASLPVRQGDLLICRDPQTGTVEEICLVITADCDISKGKFGQQLVCLRVVSFDDYLRTTWAERKLRRMIETETEKVRSQMAKWHAQRIGEESHLSGDAAAAWVRRSEPEAICNELGVPDTDKKKLVNVLGAYRSALAVLGGDGLSDALRQLVAFRAAVQNRDINSCRQEALRQAQNEPLPDDVFLVPTLPQLDCGAAIVRLREIVGVNYEAVCYRAVDATTSDMFLRIGRLNPTFKYAVSQAFGALYSRIGLPDEYERRCQAAINQLSDFEWE